MFVVISGCSGGGKSTLLAELARRGFSVVEEPASRVLAQERSGDGSALPWVDALAFGQRTLAMSLADHAAATGLTFFDRGVVDATVIITARGGQVPPSVVANHRYDRLFLAPPWPQIYATSADRLHDFEKARRNHERIRSAYVDAGYRPIILPLATVAARAEFVLTHLAGPAPVADMTETDNETSGRFSR